MRNHKDERLNTLTHLFGAALAFCGSAVLLFLAAAKGDPLRIFSFSIYGLTTVGLYCASTLYHGSNGQSKEFFRKLDYSGIYFKIAGNYTPFMLITLKGFSGWSILAFVWLLAGFGVTQELMIGQRTRRWSFAIYGLMSLASIAVIDELARALPLGGFLWILGGYLCYAIGAFFFFNDERIKHGHAIWHVCVVAGAACQYLCLLFYVA